MDIKFNKLKGAVFNSVKCREVWFNKTKVYPTASSEPYLKVNPETVWVFEGLDSLVSVSSNINWTSF